MVQVEVAELERREELVVRHTVSRSLQEVGQGPVRWTTAEEHMI